jgi:hypothetical protein
MSTARERILCGGLIAGWALGLGLSAGAASIQPVSHVVHISVDGLAAVYLQDYVSNAPAQFPTFWFLVTNGAFTFNARCDFDNSYTLPNHASMLTGRPVLQPDGQPDTVPHGYTTDVYVPGQTLQNAGNINVPYKASAFDVVHDHGLSTALFSSKPKFAFYVESYDAVNGAPSPYGQNKIDFNLLTDCGTNPPSYIASTPLVDALVEQLASAPWNYVFLHFGDTDWVGHDMWYDGGWGSPKWSNTVAYVDGQLGRILAAIQANPALANQTALIVTADHGGGGNYCYGDYCYSHTDETQLLNYTIPLFLWGPGIPAGADLYSLVPNRGSPGADRPDYNAQPQPLRNGDSGNLAVVLLGLPTIPGSFMRPTLDAMAYPLAIRRAGSTQTVSWAAGATDYRLEVTDALGPNPVWREVTEGIVLDGAFNSYAVPAAGSATAQFFRLNQR